ARDATLRIAELLLKENQSSAVPLALKPLVAKDDGAALLLAGRAAEQVSDSTKALAAYRRLYFFAPAAEESAEAAKAIARLGSNTSPGNVDEARERADRLYSGKKFADAVQAYTEAFAKFPATVTPERHLRRGISAFNVRRTPEAIASFNAIPTSAGETRAEGLSF